MQCRTELLKRNALLLLAAVGAASCGLWEDPVEDKASGPILTLGGQSTEALTFLVPEPRDVTPEGTALTSDVDLLPVTRGQPLPFLLQTTVDPPERLKVTFSPVGGGRSRECTPPVTATRPAPVAHSTLLFAFCEVPLDLEAGVVRLTVTGDIPMAETTGDGEAAVATTLLRIVDHPAVVVLRFQQQRARPQGDWETSSQQWESRQGIPRFSLPAGDTRVGWTATVDGKLDGADTSFKLVLFDSERYVDILFNRSKYTLGYGQEVDSDGSFTEVFEDLSPRRLRRKRTAYVILHIAKVGVLLAQGVIGDSA